ncbi:MAG: DUF6288 domain-containing protein [Rubritalea sp.]
MMKKQNSFVLFAVLLMTVMGSSPAKADDGLTSVMKGSSYYKVYPLFNPHPVDNRNYTVSRFGPVGIGIDLIKPAFTMKIRNVEKGSPADGKLEKGQIIESINGQVLKDIDPRMWLGKMIAMAEAADGQMKFKLKDAPKTVLVQIPALGAYSKTWPLNCKKSDKIVRDLADHLAENGKFNGPGLDGIELLFMLSTGEEKDLEVARGWIKNAVEKHKDVKEMTSDSYWTWMIAYTGPAVCEYYLRTGDKSVMHLIELMTDYSKRTMYNGGWSQRGLRITFPYMGGAHINACGVHAVTFLLLAKECGAEVDEFTLQESLKQFYRFAGRGNVAYGDQLPEKSFVDNGKTGALAFTMAAAASLTPEGEESIYAKARDISAVKSFYSTSWLNHGHTGGGIGEIWRGASMGLMMEKKPTKHREFMDARQWFYDISRRFDGSFGIVGGGSRYDKEPWGTGMALSYTVPRKTLRMTGAPKTKYSKHYQLPKRPWGTAADEEFYNLSPISGSALTSKQVDAEKLATHGSWPVYRLLMDPKVSDKVLLEYAHHPDHGIRRYTVDAIYKHKRDKLILTLLKSKDPRARQAGAMAIYGTFKRSPMKKDRLTSEMIKLLTDMINDPKESHWVVYNAMMSLNVCDAKTIEPHVDRLVYWLEHEEWWLNLASMNLLNKVATNPKYYKKILPLYGKKIVNNRRTAPLSPLGELTSKLKKATPEVQKLGAEILGVAYGNFPTGYIAPGGSDMHGGADYFQGVLNNALTNAPGGIEIIKTLPKRTSAWQKSRKDSDLYSFDGKVNDTKNLLGKWTVIDRVQDTKDFKIDKKMNLGKSRFKEIVFKAGGETSSASMIWTGKKLIDLTKNQMLLMEGKNLDGQTYLFIEAGGFTTGKPMDWHPGWSVLKQGK